MSDTAELARRFGEAVSDLVCAPTGPLATLVRIRLADGRELTFGARDLATGAAIADGIVRPTLARLIQRDAHAGRTMPTLLALGELRRATARYFIARAATITRDNARSVLAGRIPEDQAVVKVEQVAPAGALDGLNTYP